MEQQKQIYYANSSIVLPEGKKYKNAFKLNLQFLFDDQVGSQNFTRFMWRVSGRGHDYFRSIYEHQEDYRWPQHAHTLELFEKFRRNKKKAPYIGKAKFYKDNNRIEHTSCLLVYDKELDIFDVDFWMNKHHCKLTLTPQSNKLYPYRGEYHSNIDISTGSVKCPF